MRTELVSNIWVVTGETGKYSDRSQWTVCAYATQAEADQHVELAQAEADNIRRRLDAEGRYYSREPNKYDSQAKMDYTGTTYRLSMVEVLRIKVEGGE